MTYTPDIRDYQQLPLGGSTGPFDCSAWSGAILTDAHTEGRTRLSGRSIRLHTDEAIPDRLSPGLNLPQVDAAVYEITGGKVNLDTRVQAQAMSRWQAQALIIDGRWATVQVLRGVLVDRNAGGNNGFRGSHALTVHARPIDNATVLGDPLVPYYIGTTWDALWDAAEALTRPFAPGKVYAQFTRDLTPDYAASIHPTAGYEAVRFWEYLLDADGYIRHAEPGRVRRRTAGFSASCTPPKWHGSRNAGIAARSLVQLTSGSRKDMFVDARYAREVIP